MWKRRAFVDLPGGDMCVSLLFVLCVKTLWDNDFCLMMRKIMSIPSLIVSGLLLLCCGGYDDSALADRVSSLESRVSTLESKVNTNAASIQGLLDAARSSDPVVGFKALEDGSGYVLTLASGKSLTLLNGKDGKEPSVSVKKDSDGFYCWTVDGEFMMVDGHKVKAEGKDAVTPKFKIEKDIWMVSYDGGSTWSDLGRAKDETILKSVSIVDGIVKIILGDGTQINLPLADSSIVSAVESINYLPSFSDGCARAYRTASGCSAELTFEVLPESALKALYGNKSVSISVSGICTEVATRTSVGDFLTLPTVVKKAEGAFLTVSADLSKAGESFLSGDLGMNVSLHITDGVKSIASAYVPVVYGGQKPVSRTFNSKKVVLSVAALSDVHINTGTTAPSTKFVKALNQLKAKAAEDDQDGIDGVLIAGDLIDTPNSSYLAEFKSKYESVMDPVKVPMVYTVGNHDVPNYRWSSSMVSDAAYMRSGLGSNYFLTDQDKESGSSLECRHCVIGGYNVLSVTPNGTQPVSYDPAAIAWLEAKLKAITEAEPDKYVILITHPMISDTVYGSLLGEAEGEWSSTLPGYWATKALTSVLDKYPQVVAFGGHLHFPLNDPRSVWQGNFTVLGCASVRYMALESGGYDQMASATTMKDKDEFSQGNLVQFDADGNMRIFRMDFYNGDVIGAPLTMQFPEGTEHLQKYSHVRRSLQNSAPETPVASVNVSSGRASVTFHAKDDEFVHDYTLTLAKGSQTIWSAKVLADFYRHPKTDDMSTSIIRDMGEIGTGDFTLTIVARDSWGAESKLVKDFSITAPSRIWADDNAGSRKIAAGSGTASSGWLSYSDGTLSWTANGTGSPRMSSINLPDGSSCTVTQISVEDFKGSWTLYSKLFDPNRTLGKGNVAADATSVTFGEPLEAVTLPDDSGVSHTNNIGIKGLYKDAVMDASVEIDYENCSVRLGVFCDLRKTRSAGSVGNMVFLPECARLNTWGDYEFAPKDFSPLKYVWIWFSADKDSLDAYRWTYYKSSRKLADKYYICGISCVKASTSDPASIASTYDVIYQANYNGSNTDAMCFKKNK